jgi:hypothetical protein
MFIKKNYLKEGYDLDQQIKKLQGELKEIIQIIESEKIIQDGDYKYITQTDKTRKIDPEVFKVYYGNTIFTKIATISVTAAEAEVGKNKLAEGNKEGNYLSTVPKVTKKIIKL